jgi:hypothetical protein
MVGNIKGISGGSDDKEAANLAGWRFIKESDFAARARWGGEKGISLISARQTGYLLAQRRQPGDPDVLAKKSSKI